MPTLAFIPWATLSQSVRVGQFHLVPCGEAVASGAIPADLKAGVSAILSMYGKTRPVDRRHVPLTQHDSVGLVDDLSDELIEAYFEFRQRLAFSVLAAREFFRGRYANSENASLVVQRFTPEHAGATVITSRRRDGSVNNIIPKGALQIRRPQHVSGWCELPREMDVALLEGLEAAAATQTELWPRLADAIRLFVGANTDSPDVGLHNELVDMVSAFSRLANSWKEDGTVEAFIERMPSPEPLATDETDQGPLPAPGFGPKLKHPRVISGLDGGRTIRELWLRDAYRLRSQVGHGHVTKSRYDTTWATHEHLLLGAVAFPLYVKRVLATEGVYSWTRDDQRLDEIFDALATLEPFATSDDDDADKGQDDQPRRLRPWREAFNRANNRRLAKLLYEKYDEIAAAAPDDDQTGT